MTTASDWTSPDGSARVLLGDVRQRMAELPAGSVQAVVTSPPYWALRDYGTGTWEGGDAACNHVARHDATRVVEATKNRHGGFTPWPVCGKCGARRIDQQIGSEATPEEYLATMVDVFRGVRRVLRDDGICFVNMGDSYATEGGRQRGSGDTDRGQISRACQTIPGRAPNVGAARNGNQLLMPHRLALAMQAEGWTLRSTIVWAKKSPMPESLSGVRWIRCRVKIGPSEQRPIPTATGRVDYNVPGAHASKGTPDTSAKWAPCPGCEKCSPHGGFILRWGAHRCTTAHEYIFQFTKGMQYFCDGEACKEWCSPNTNGKGRILRNKAGVEGVERNNSGWSRATAGEVSNRNPRSVWSLSSEPFKGAHFATFPGQLVYRCLLAATSQAGCCPQCGAGWAPVVEIGQLEPLTASDRGRRVRQTRGDVARDQATRDDTNLPRHHYPTTVSGYRPTCACDAGPAVPMTVLDPFSGSGTTGQVCRYMGLRYVGVELSPEYLEMSKARIMSPWKPRHERKPASKRKKRQRAQLELWGA